MNWKLVLDQKSYFCRSLETVISQPNSRNTKSGARTGENRWKEQVEKGKLLVNSFNYWIEIDMMYFDVLHNSFVFYISKFMYPICNRFLIYLFFIVIADQCRCFSNLFFTSLVFIVFYFKGWKFSIHKIWSYHDSFIEMKGRRGVVRLYISHEKERYNNDSVTVVHWCQLSAVLVQPTLAIPL